MILKNGTVFVDFAGDNFLKPMVHLFPSISAISLIDFVSLALAVINQVLVCSYHEDSKRTVEANVAPLMTASMAVELSFKRCSVVSSWRPLSNLG